MFGTRSIILSFCLIAICLPLSAEPASRETGLRLASAQEGEAIVQAAWELRRGLTPKPDCSHFVHAVYTQAGFLYEYAASRAIFAGIERFRRISKAQPGDVIVWQGHIGIVIDPREHSFYSSVTSGFAIESYKSHYWKGRGNPRFYRFVVNDPPSSPTLPLKLALVSSRSDKLLSSLTKFVAPPPPALTEPHTPETLVRLDGSEVELDSSVDGSRAYAEVQPAQGQQQPGVIEDLRGEIPWSEVATTVGQTSGEIAVTSRERPSKKEVLAAVLESADRNGKQLLQTGSLDSQPSVSVVDRLRIVAINLQGRSGLADLEVKQNATFQYGKAIPIRTTARRHVILNRQEQGWVLVRPQDLMCLNRDLAVAALSEDLATMTLLPTNSPDQKRSLKVLHQLAQKTSSPHWWVRLARVFTA
jgi:hypothetical protein